MTRVEDAGTFEVEKGKRLVLTMEGEAGVDILRDGGPQPQKASEFRLGAVITKEGSQLLPLEHQRVCRYTTVRSVSEGGMNA